MRLGASTSEQQRKRAAAKAAGSNGWRPHASPVRVYESVGFEQVCEHILTSAAAGYRIEEQGSAKDIFERPQSPRLAEFLKNIRF